MKIQLIPAKDIIKTTPTGDIDLDKARKVLAKVVSVKNVPEDHVIIIDARNTKAKMTITDIYYLASELDKHRKSFQKKSALIVSKKDFDLAKFYELCANNRGFLVGAFTDFEEAIEWISSPIDIP